MGGHTYSEIVSVYPLTNNLMPYEVIIAPGLIITSLVVHFRISMSDEQVVPSDKELEFYNWA